MAKMAGGTLAALLAGTTVVGPAAATQAIPCGQRAELPAYAHNDYDNRRPLEDALDLGYRGVEADVLLRGGELRVGHDASGTRPGRTLEQLYLRPLRTRIQHCGGVVAPVPFLLNVELKQQSRAAYDSLLALLERYPDVFKPTLPGPGGRPPVEIVLVGWHPGPKDSVRGPGFSLGYQQQIMTLATGADTSSTGEVRLVSLRRLARAYNVPVNAAVYRMLLQGGVDLVGTRQLSESRLLLLGLSTASSP